MTLMDPHLAPVQPSNLILYHSPLDHEVQTQQPSFCSLNTPSAVPLRALAFAAPFSTMLCLRPMQGWLLL